MLRILIYALPIVLAVYALVDLVQTRDEDVQGLPKLVWVAAHRAHLGRRDRSPGCSPAARAGGSPGSRRGQPARPAASPARWRRTTTPTSCAA